MLTEIKLNDVYYKLVRLPVQTLANQMASKVGQGTSEYADLTTWSAWVQQDWQEGVGKVKPHLNGGFLFGEAESRVPGQLILPPFMNNVKNEFGIEQNPGPPSGQHIVGNGGYQKIAQHFKTQALALLSTHKFWIYASITSPNTELTFEIWTRDGSGNPLALLESTTYAAPEDNAGFYYHGVSLDATSLSINQDYSLVVYPTNAANSFIWAAGDQNNDLFNLQGKSYDGSTWTTLPAALNCCSFLSNIYPLGTTSSGAGFFRFNSKLYCYSSNKVFWFNASGGFGSDPEWEEIGTITGVTNVTGATVFGTDVYFGNKGGDGDFTSMGTGETFTDSGVDGAVFTKWKGKLWKAVGATVEHSVDGSVWEPTNTFGEPITVSDSSDPITGLCPMGNVMYAATTAGLVPIYEGDVVWGGYTWGSLDAQNGMRMVEFEGALYATVNGRVTRFTEDGSMQDVWLTRDDDVLTGRIGKVWDLEKVNNWLFALVGSTDATGKPTIWAYQNNSWHHIATLPSSTSSVSDIYIDYDLYYDRSTQKLWCITPDLVTYNWYVPDYTLNPFNDANASYMRTAWVEWDWFDGQILEADKDYDSVTIMGENLSSTCFVEVYWKDDASTTWELLGTADSNHEELKWTITGGTRPNTKRFKLALLLFTADSTETPRIRAFRVKYHLMVRDWFRWNLQVKVSGRSGGMQATPDGDRNTLTASQIKDNIDALVQQVPPFVYVDVDGNQYLVKVTDANFTYELWEYAEHAEGGADTYFEGTYNLVLEQVTSGEYTP